MYKTALTIIQKLQSNGYETYLAGGCVRDILLGQEPNDYDLVTSARPEEMEKLLAHTIPIGKQFGVILAVKNGHHFEIATFRSEDKYSDKRRPDQVFWSDAKNDALRRDFTINGLFYDPIKKKVIDYVDGQIDLKKKIIRFIGEPVKRIKEDNLRILRAIRFKNTLGFKYHRDTWTALKSNAALITNVSWERIRDELNKMFNHPNRYHALIDLNQSNILKYLLPEIESMKGVPQPDQFHHEGDVFIHTSLAIKKTPPQTPLFLVWSVLFHDSGKPKTITFPKTKQDRIRFNRHIQFSARLASRALRRLKFPNQERELIVWLVKNHMMPFDIPKMRLAKKRVWLQDHRFPYLLELFRLDALGAKPLKLDVYQENLKLYRTNLKLLAEEAKKPKIKKLVTGNDLIIKLGMTEGPLIGDALKIVKEAQLEEKIKTQKQALKYIRLHKKLWLSNTK